MNICSPVIVSTCPSNVGLQPCGHSNVDNFKNAAEYGLIPFHLRLYDCHQCVCPFGCTQTHRKLIVCETNLLTGRPCGVCNH